MEDLIFISIRFITICGKYMYIKCKRNVYTVVALRLPGTLYHSMTFVIKTKHFSVCFNSYLKFCGAASLSFRNYTGVLRHGMF